MPVPKRDYRFNFPRNVAIYPQMRFRFAGIEYIATRLKTEGDYKKVRAAIALEPSENAPDLDEWGERDPEGKSCLVSFRCPACAADFFPTLRPHPREANILHTTCPGCRGELRLFRTGMPDGSWAARLLSNP